jgi:lipopolysaccharide transport system permease protein
MRLTQTRPDSLVPENPTTHKLVIEPPSGWSQLDLAEVWQHRELLFFLVWRDLTVRYKQTILGPLWAVINPFASMIIFSLFLGGLVGVPSDGIPYPLFSFAALVPWALFTNTLSRSGGSLIGNANLITKVYFPRLVIPFSNALSSLIDFLLAFVLLIGMMLVYGYIPTINIIFLPVFIILSMVIGLGVGLWLAALNVRFRDINFFLPFLLQAWLYASPVVYPATLIKGDFLRLLYNLNPMASVIDGFRWALLDVGNPPGAIIILPILVAILALLGGMLYFKKTERVFTDVI